MDFSHSHCHSLLSSDLYIDSGYESAFFDLYQRVGHQEGDFDDFLLDDCILVEPKAVDEPFVVQDNHGLP